MDDSRNILCLWRSCSGYSFFPCQFPSAVGFHHPIHRIRYPVSTRARKTRKKKPCSCNGHCLIFFAFSWRYTSRLWHLQCGGHSIWFCTSPPTFSSHQGYQGSANIHPEILQGWLGRPGGEFEDGGAANQPVILQGGVGLSSGQVYQVFCQSQYNLSWLPEIGD